MEGVRPADAGGPGHQQQQRDLPQPRACREEREGQELLQQALEIIGQVHFGRESRVATVRSQAGKLAQAMEEHAARARQLQSSLQQVAEERAATGSWRREIEASLLRTSLENNQVAHSLR